MPLEVEVEIDQPDDLVIDVEEWQAQLSLPEDTAGALLSLEKRFERLNQAFGQLLVYANMLDDRVQELGGEKQVTVKVQSHIGNDGIAEVHRMKPEVPELEDRQASGHERDGLRDPTQLIDKSNDASRLAKMVVKP